MLPLKAGVDVINVRGLSFKRFLDIAKPLGKRVAVVTDNDGKSSDDVAARFADYTGAAITIHTGEFEDGTTLEPQLVAANELDDLNEILGTKAASGDELVEHMQAAKTASALASSATRPSRCRNTSATPSAIKVFQIHSKPTDKMS